MLNDKDILYIEKLCRASLMNKQEYFPTLNDALTFDFLSIQSHIIRKYFLRYRINYRHIIRKYQCYIRRTTGTNTIMNDIETFDLDEKYSIPLSTQQLETNWNHLKEMLLDKLYHGHRLLRQIALLLKHNEKDQSSNNLYEFLESTGDNNSIRQQLEQYEIKNFQLCHFDCVRKLYEKSITGFEHLFTDVSHLLRTPIDPQLNAEFTQILQTALLDVDYGDEVDKINNTIQNISSFLNDLKDIQDALLQKSTHSLRKIYEAFSADNPVIECISDDIKCENYVDVSIHLIKIRSSLQERIINFNEKEIKLWDEDFLINSHHRTHQNNIFQNYLNAESDLTASNRSGSISSQDDWEFFRLEHVAMEPSTLVNTTIHDFLVIEDYEKTRKTTIIEQTGPKIYFEEKIEYSTLFQLFIKLVPITSSTFAQKLHEQRQKTDETEAAPATKAQKFIVTYPDARTIGHLWNAQKLYEQFRKVFSEKKYDSNTLVVVDKDQIFLDFTNTNYQPSRRILLEYHIIEKSLLIQVQFNFQAKLFEYLVTSKANVSTIIERFIQDNTQLISKDIYLSFLDEFGRCIEYKTIADINSDKLINIIVREDSVDTGSLCEVTLRSKQGKHFTVFKFQLSKKRYVK
jgi:hypothetical protein